MKNMIRQLGERVLGVLSGFDRLLFRGILRCVINPRGLNGYLFGANVRMADFKEHTQQVTQQLIDESLRYASENGRTRSNSWTALRSAKRTSPWKSPDVTRSQRG